MVSGSRPVIPAGPTIAHWHSGHGTAQSPRHVSALRGTPPKFSCASSSQNLSPHLLHLTWVMPRPLQDNLSCNEDRQTPNVTAGWEYPRAPHAKLFSSLSFAFQSPPTTHLFQPSPWCDNTMLWFVSFEVSKYIDALANKRLLQADRHDFPAEITALHPLPPMADI